MKKFFLLCLGFFVIFNAQSKPLPATPSRLALLKAMFDEVTIKKNLKAIPTFYAQDFLLFSNGHQMDFEQLIKTHTEIYKTPIQYSIRYEEDSFVENGDKIAGRLFITTKKPKEKSQEIEVILVAQYKGKKLYRVWELTYPDWSQMKAFQKNA